MFKLINEENKVIIEKEILEYVRNKDENHLELVKIM